MEANTRSKNDRSPPAPMPPLPWSVRLPLLALVAATDLAQRPDGSVNRFLFSLGDRHIRASPRPDARGVRSADVTVDASRDLWARVYSVAAKDSPSPRPVVVFFHGGGFALLSAASKFLDSICRILCSELGAVIVSVNYRLAPEHRYPAAYDDGMDVLRYLSDTGLPAGFPSIDLSRCFLAGDCPGGNISHHVAQRWTSSSPPLSTAVRLVGIILLQPFFGGEERTESELRLEGVAPVLNMRRSDRALRAFLPVGANRNHPAVHVTGEAGPEPELAAAFPPALVLVAGFDPMQDWQRRYAAMLRRQGKAVRLAEFPDAIHGFYCFPELPDFDKLVQEIKTFVASCLSSP